MPILPNYFSIIATGAPQPTVRKRYETMHWLGSVVEVVAPIVSFLSYFAGLQYCLSIYNAGNTKGFSSFPLVIVLVSLVFWVRYGILRSDTAVIVSSAVGLLVYVGYNVFYYCYTQGLKRKLTLLAMYGVCGALDLTMLVLMLVFIDRSHYAYTEPYLGAACSIIQILAFASPLAGVMEVFKRRSCASLPLFIIILNAVLSVLWFVYGLFAGIVWLLITDGFGMALCAIQLSLFIFFPAKDPEDDQPT